MVSCSLAIPYLSFLVLQAINLKTRFSRYFYYLPLAGMCNEGYSMCVHGYSGTTGYEAPNELMFDTGSRLGTLVLQHGQVT